MYNIMRPFICFAIRADLVILTTLLFYVPSLFWCQDYLFDDGKAIISNPDVVRQNNSFVKIFCHDFWGTKLTDPSSHKSYRPLTILVFRFIFSWNSIILFRIFNIILHLINTYLVTKLSRLLDCKGWILTSLIFGLHPVHAEPVLAFVGASDLLYSQVILISLIMVITYRNDLVYGVSSFLCLLSVAYKEQGIMLLPMVLALDVFVKKNRVKKVCLKILYIIVLSFTILYWRLYIMNFDPPSFQEGDNPASFIKNPFLRILNYSYIYIMNLWILIAPVWLCFDWSMGCISTIQEPTKDFRTFFSDFQLWTCNTMSSKMYFLQENTFNSNTWSTSIPTFNEHFF
ncbi:protein O-mannosyl-transferase F38B6.6 [Lepeophtheirus salmonis]|uniref:protein O-mannosyl-transferase F38B6.6 n=1 Tax=Lepeophtheirus salmonis TaxID=72036 RepID=UPI001AE7D4FD|nr:protein O-mannosyl-transferase TMTC4-like [Lepeophtheirus salmonis]